MKIQSVNSQSFEQKFLKKNQISQIPNNQVRPVSSQSAMVNMQNSAELGELVLDEKGKIARFKSLFTPLTRFEFAVEDFAGKIIDIFTRTKK
jgi:hypothetical protein